MASLRSTVRTVRPVRPVRPVEEVEAVSRTDRASDGFAGTNCLSAPLVAERLPQLLEGRG